MRYNSAMFNARSLRSRPGSVLHEDNLRSVELTTAFRRIQCYRCDHSSIYKYRVKQIRRTPELSEGDEGSMSPYLLEMWQSIPRFAEIPETVKCKRCGEVLGLYTNFIF